jgi:hypothetical protein
LLFVKPLRDEEAAFSSLQQERRRDYEMLRFRMQTGLFFEGITDLRYVRVEKICVADVFFEMLMLWTEGTGILLFLFDEGNQFFFLGGRPPLNSFRIAAIFLKYSAPRLAVLFPPICPARFTIRLSGTGLPQCGHLSTNAA